MKKITLVNILILFFISKRNISTALVEVIFKLHLQKINCTIIGFVLKYPGENVCVFVFVMCLV